MVCPICGEPMEDAHNIEYCPACDVRSPLAT